MAKEQNSVSGHVLGFRHVNSQRAPACGNRDTLLFRQIQPVRKCSLHCGAPRQVGASGVTVTAAAGSSAGPQ